MLSILQKQREKDEVVGIACVTQNYQSFFSLHSILLIFFFSNNTSQASGSASKQGNGTDWSEKSLEAMTARDWRIMREEFDITVQGVRNVNPLRFWSEANIHHSILEAIAKLGYKDPSPIQRQAIPLELRGYDMIGIAKTGSGKTCAFVVPMLEYVSID